MKIPNFYRCLSEALTALLLMATAGCGTGTTDPGSAADTTGATADANLDAAADGVADVVADVGLDPASDAMEEKSADAGQDAAADAGPDASPDITWSDAAVGQSCTAGQECPGGLICWTPKTMGGAMPQSICLPPLGPDECYDNSACNGGGCWSASPQEGISGKCLPKVPPGQCWPELGPCLPGSTCEGASVCPKGGMCVVADKPGTCKAGPEVGGKVWLWNPGGSLMIPGMESMPTWVNYSTRTIFLPGCTTWETEQEQGDGTWKNLGPPAMCAWEGVAVAVEPGAYHQDMAWKAPQPAGGMGLGNYRFTGTYSLGCTPGEPISAGKCTSQAKVVSESTFVGYPP